MNINEIVPRDNFLLYIKADDCTAGEFDVKPYLESEAFAPLKDRHEFDRIYNGKYFIEWGCGADLSADTIQARWKIVSSDSAQLYAPADAPISSAPLI
jgi:hypothetical protein